MRHSSFRLHQVNDHIQCHSLVNRKDLLLNTETHTYDNNGNLATLTDQKSQVTIYTYDPLDRRTKVTFQDGTGTNYTCDGGNRITQVQEKNSGGTFTATITRTYDGLDRLTQEVTPQGQIDYAYDNASRRATMTVVGQTQGQKKCRESFHDTSTKR